MVKINYVKNTEPVGVTIMYANCNFVIKVLYLYYGGIMSSKDRTVWLHRANLISYHIANGNDRF